ncbi:MAG: hypothetical protein EXR77_12945 [Myxococcales bacterium]|nr:hypothetical protein [Myxococcales bacterium]
MTAAMSAQSLVSLKRNQGIGAAAVALLAAFSCQVSGSGSGSSNQTPPQDVEPAADVVDAAVADGAGLTGDATAVTAALVAGFDFEVGPAGPCGALLPQTPPAPKLHNDPKRLVRNQHMTWQHDTATTLTVTWTTEVTDLKAYTPRVVFGQAEPMCADGRYLLKNGQVAQGTGALYDTVVGESQATLVAWTVELKDLKPETDYVFRVGTWTQLDAGQKKLVAPELGKVGRFRTAPTKGTRTAMPFVFAGDSRGGAKPITLRSPEYAKIPALAWFFSGDMNSVGVQTEWNEWFKALEPILDAHPLLPVQGNHEVFAAVYYNQFALPAMPGLPSDYVEHAWALDFGNVHFVGLDSNSLESCEDTAKWLAADLQKAQNDKDIDWTIVQYHHTTYSAGPHGQTGYVVATWVPLFEKHGVDLVINGHDHLYERSVPIIANKETTQDKGVTYVVAGGFFAPPYKNGTKWWTKVSVHGEKNNYAQLLVNGKALTVTAWSGDGNEKLDEFTLTR